VHMAVKRVFDILLSSALIVLLLPLFLFIILLIKLDSAGPAFFVQERAGQFGRPFKIYKFRTMIQDAISMGDGVNVKQNDFRITKTGGFLREWSLDELPQIFNIFKGDMSFVGPRPTLMYQIKKYSEEQRKRLNMKPGLTGLAQINGRNNLSWPEKIKYDVQYVENFNLLLDIKILVKTIWVILGREGTYELTNNVKKGNENEPACY
jgi:undecaprenyl phosphate N,N'-diacetylbacillosamine 1-phosphate transferase